MIKNRTIIICFLLWLFLGWFIVVNKITIEAKLYPPMTIIYF